MRLNLKRVLARLSLPQKDVAAHCDVSSALIAQLVNHGIWPRNDSLRAELHQRITAILKAAGADAEMIATAFEEWPLPRSNAAEADAPHSPDEHPTTEEDEHMLLRNETLTDEALDHFRLERSPFSKDIRSLDDVFNSPATRRTRAALMDCALNQGFLALVGESGSGKSTLREELEERIRVENKPVIVITPYVMEMQKSERHGKPMHAGQISEAIIRKLAPGETVKSSTQARNDQVKEFLLSSMKAGYKSVLIIEEAHRMPVSTLRSLKGYMELKEGLQPLLGVILIGQPELDHTISDKLADVREIIQRCQRREMLPLDDDLQPYLAHKFARVGAKLADVFADDACDAIRARLVRIPRGGAMKEAHSICYPLVVNNLVVRALNAAAAVQFPRVNAQVVRGC